MKTVVLSALLALASTAAHAEASQREQLLSFLKDHLNGVVFESESHGTLQDGRVRSDLVLVSTYTNVQAAGREVSFDLHQSIKQTLTDLDASGQPVGTPRVMDRFNLSRYSLVEMQSTGNLLGNLEWLMTTSDGYTPGQVKPVAAFMRDGKLILERFGPFYDDLFATGGGFYPGTYDLETVFSVVDGKVLSERPAYQLYKVDPETLERTPYFTVDASTSVEHHRIATTPAYPEAAQPVAEALGDTQRDELLAFLTEHVDGVVLHRETESTLQDGRVHSKFAMDQTYGNLRADRRGISIDVVQEITQTLQDLDAAGNPVGQPRRADRTNTARLTFAASDATGYVLGSTKTLSSTYPGVTSALPSLFAAFLKDGKLVLKYRQALYGDYFAAAGGYYPGASDSESIWSVVDGKLQVDSPAAEVYQVDPETFQRLAHYTAPASTMVEVRRIPHHL